MIWYFCIFILFQLGKCASRLRGRSLSIFPSAFQTQSIFLSNSPGGQRGPGGGVNISRGARCLPYRYTHAAAENLRSPQSISSWSPPTSQYVVFRSRRSVVSLTKSTASCWSTVFTSRNYGRRIEPVKSVFIRLYCYQQILSEDGNLMCTTLLSQHDNCKRVFQAVYYSKISSLYYTTSVGVYIDLCVCINTLILMMTQIVVSVCQSLCSALPSIPQVVDVVQHCVAN
jgi:hypothetical protein